jgi:hypothetical protein
MEKDCGKLPVMSPVRIYLIGFAALLALSSPRVSAGTVAYSMNLFNNTEYPIELIHVRKGSSLETIPPGRGKILPYKEGLTIKVDGRQVHYERVDPPLQGYARKGLFSLTLRAQLNSDLKIWLLPLSANWPSLKPLQQPPGFPLIPR